MENARKIAFSIISYALSISQLNIILVILLINQCMLESQKTLVTLYMPKKN